MLAVCNEECNAIDSICGGTSENQRVATTVGVNVTDSAIQVVADELDEMLAVCDKMCNAIDSICNDISEKYATASVAVNTTLFANTGSALGVVADELDEILAVCHETCNAIDNICVEIDIRGAHMLKKMSIRTCP